MELFDLEICLPVFLQGKWGDRLRAFRKHGLLNTRGVKTRLVLLAGTQHEPGLAKGWPVDEVAVVRAETDDAAAKIYSYYFHMSLSDIGRSRWFLRVDDDSSTDVGGMVRALDRRFSWRDPLHLIAWHSSGGRLTQPYAQWLDELGCSHIPSAHCLTDWEVSVTSQTAMLRALCEPRSRELLRRASEFRGSWGDIGLALCCQIAGIGPSPCPLLDSGPAVSEFSLFGGEIHHIHLICPDQEEHYAAFLKRLEATF